jgi:hypothetical protein
MTAQYLVAVDTSDNQTYATLITPDVLRLSWRIGIASPYDLVAAHSAAEITLYNREAQYSPESLSTPLKIGRRVRIQIKPDALSPARTHFVGFIRSVKPTTGELGERLAVVRVTGAEEEYDETHVLMPLQVNVSADEVLDRVFDTTPLTRIATDFEAGISLFSYVGDLWGDGITGANAIREMVEAERGRFYTTREGVATFRNRYHLQSLTALDATFTNEMVGMEYDYGAGMVNSVRVRVRPRQLGTLGSVLWTLDSPQMLRFGVTLEIVARLYDDSGQRIGALTVLPLTPYTDYTANTLRDGTGADRTPQLIVGLTLVSGGAVKLTLFNGGIDTLYVQPGMQIRGTPIYPGDSVLVERGDQTSQLTHGIRTLSLSLPALDAIDEADAIAQYELSRRITPRGEALTLTLDERNRFDDALRLTLFNRIRVIEAHTNHDSEYFIVAEAHEVSTGGYKHRVKWTLEPVSSVVYPTLD